MPQVSLSPGQEYTQIIPITEKTRVLYAGKGSITVTLGTIYIGTLNSRDNVLDLEVAGSYTFTRSGSISCSSTFIYETVLGSGGSGTPVVPPVPDPNAIIDRSIQPMKYLPGGVAPCVMGWVIASTTQAGAVIITATDFNGTPIDIVVDTIVSTGV